MKNLLISLSLLAVPGMAAAGAFLEARTAEEVFEHVQGLSGSVQMFVDIDDTVQTPASKTFRKPPTNQMIDEIKKNKGDYPNYPEIVGNWRLQRKPMLVDSKWPEVLSKLKELFPVYGLTKMDTGVFGNIPSMEEWRYIELKSLGIEFSKSSTIPEGVIEGASFHKGIFITGPNSKSGTLAHYKDYLGEMTTLVMVDDREEHLRDLEQFCVQNGIQFVGILFKGLESLEGEANPAIAAFQKEHLITHAEWLEDDAARGMLAAQVHP